MSNAEIMSGYTFQALGRNRQAREAIEALEARVAELEARMALLPELEARLGKLDADMRGLARCSCDDKDEAGDAKEQD